MKILKTILALIGTLVLAGMLLVGVKYGGMLKQFDPEAVRAFSDMAKLVLETGDPAKGMILKKKMVIPEDMTKEEAIANAIEVMDEVASAHGLAMVDHKVMPRKTGIYTQIRSYCSPTIADEFLTYSREYIGFMPCRIGIIEEPNGDIYLYTMNLDLMIHGGKKLPTKLRELAMEVNAGMMGMFESGAAGEELE
ncbi:DUF302 domain-containing protein [Sulfurovum sp.]|jgi:uncharacterized protein (DUF302 family)|uniref:DUF302 domain-containing protein n=1 Tax=Sulfurovum sp. TaxID=1969726 RepID=UPI0025DEECC9|nr:DUF302 domain-containing protein [Sulfurovum sp.]